MPINLKDIKINLNKAYFLVICIIVINGCSSMDFTYITREEVKNVSFAQEKSTYVDKTPLSLGAVRLTSKDSKPGDMGQVFFLQRKKGVYMAETKISDTGKKRYFFSVGVDYQEKTPAMGFRLEF